MPITRVQYAFLADVVRRRSGLALPPGKSALVQSKLAPVAARFGFKKVSAMLAELEDEPEELATAVTEAMTTNETSFFRDPACFEHLRTAILPALKRARAHKRRLRIWSCAASTGQEPYSRRCCSAKWVFCRSDWKVDLFATDLSSEAVARMRNGVYSQFEVERGLPPSYRARYFTQEGEQWRIAGYLRRSLRVRRFNLLDNYGWLGEIDIILCRNVLLYFDHAEQAGRAGAAREMPRARRLADPGRHRRRLRRGRPLHAGPVVARHLCEVAQRIRAPGPPGGLTAAPRQSRTRMPA